MVAVFEESDLWKDSVPALHTFITSVPMLSALLRWQQIVKVVEKNFVNKEKIEMIVTRRINMALKL